MAGLFGAQRNKQSTTPSAVAVKETPRTPARRRGLFNRVMMNDGDPLTPNLADYLMYGTANAGNVLRGYRNSDFAYGAAQEEMANARTTMQNEAQDRQRAELTQQQTEAMIAQLPIDQQVWARLNPEAFVEQMMRQQFQGWQTDGRVPYRVGPSGVTELGSGEIPHIPRAPLVQYGSVGDDGYDYVDE